MTEIETDVLGGLVIATVLASTKKVKAGMGRHVGHQGTLELGVALDAIDMVAFHVIRCVTINVPDLDDEPSLVVKELQGE